MVLRSSDPAFLDAVRSYYNYLIPIFLPFLSTNGGPIIAVSVENEYGSYGNDHNYLSTLAAMLTEGGVDVPLYTTDGDRAFWQTFGRAQNTGFFGVNYRAKSGASAPAKRVAEALNPEQPFFIGEFWSGRSMHWGEPFYHRAPNETADAFKEALNLNGNRKQKAPWAGFALKELFYYFLISFIFSSCSINSKPISISPIVQPVSIQHGAQPMS
jgi:beta-galactosidase